MTPVVFGGISNSSLGEMLKGYGVIAVVGGECPEALFWWDDDVRLVVGGSAELTEEWVADVIRERLTEWAADIGATFQKVCTNKKRVVSGRPSPLESAAGQDGLGSHLAEIASGIAVFGLDGRIQKHPLFPGFGQDGRTNYFSTLQSESRRLAKPGKGEKAEMDLEAALFAVAPRISQKLAGTGGLFFSGAIKRYATGVSWVHEKDAPISGWDFLLAIRGACLLRGALRGLRGSKRAYSAFPFVFRGSPMRTEGKIFIVDEIFLPTWPPGHPRTLPEFEMQIRQFQARIGGGELASSSAEFRRAVQGRGVAGGFDRFYRFVLERRKPGQRQPGVQAVARGSTQVGAGATDLRLLLARIDETGWLDQLEQSHLPLKNREERLLMAARRVHDAIHACADEPTADRHLDVLDALWQGNRLLLTRGDAARIRPIPPLPSSGWERTLGMMFLRSAEARVARALASVGWDVARPIAEQILPIKFDSASRVWRVPDPKPGQRVPWSGKRPVEEFAQVFWRRWLDAVRSGRRGPLPYGSTRFATLEDVLRLLRGSLDIQEVHRYFSAFLVLDWSQKGRMGAQRATLPISFPHAILRLWLEIGIHPPPDEATNWDGAVLQCLARANPDGVREACRAATVRIRAVGLPPHDMGGDRRAGRAVAESLPVCGAEEARNMVLAVFVPISSLDTERLANRLWIPVNEERRMQEVTYA